MNPTKMFESLGAPLRNVRWSCGSIRESDGAVFLRVWQDESRPIHGKRYMWLSEEAPAAEDQGTRERLEHVQLVQSGRPCYMVMCQAEDTSAERRKVKTFNARELFEGGEVLLTDGAWWVELAGRVPVKQATAEREQPADSDNA
jgi:hypothetical protein